MVSDGRLKLSVIPVAAEDSAAEEKDRRRRVEDALRRRKLVVCIMVIFVGGVVGWTVDGGATRRAVKARATSNQAW